MKNDSSYNCFKTVLCEREKDFYLVMWFVDYMNDKISFSFGRNWQEFLKHLNDEKIVKAEVSIREFTGLESLRDLTFVDIGCGSGLFSYAAYRLGAKKIVSFDVDPFSVECCKYMHQKAGAPDNWTVLHGSILDEQFISPLRKEQFDFVYSWGVLHHTGNMWQAIGNAASLVKPGGWFYIAIYNNVDGLNGSKNWLRVKKLYNASPGPGKFILEVSYMVPHLAADVARLRNPMDRFRDKGSQRDRGMNWAVDVKDWLGGYPYEYANIEEIFTFMKRGFPDFYLKNIKSTNGLGNNYFLYKKS